MYGQLDGYTTCRYLSCARLCGSRCWNDFGPLREALEAQKHSKIQCFCYISRSATDIVQNVQISLWEVPKPPRAPRSGPGRPRRGPRGFKTAPRAAKSAPRAPPEPPKHGFRAALAAKLGPTGTKEPPGGLPKAILDPPRAGFAPSGGRFSDSFFLSESIAKAVLWAKLAQAYTQHRFTSLCNFYMWISTATGSRSIDRYIEEY